MSPGKSFRDDRECRAWLEEVVAHPMFQKSFALAFSEFAHTMPMDANSGQFLAGAKYFIKTLETLTATQPSKRTMSSELNYDPQV